MKKLNGKAILTVSILAIMLFNLASNLHLVCNILYQDIAAIKNGNISEIITPRETEDELLQHYTENMNYVNINGWFCKTIGQKIVNGVIRGTDENLYLESDLEYRFDKKIEDKQIEKIDKIINTAKNNEAVVLFVQRPDKYSGLKKVLPYKKEIKINEKYDYWCSQLKKKNVNVLDLRRIKKWDFYETDHHWTVESSWYAANIICEQMQSFNGLNEEKKNIFEKYNKKTYKDSFLGSEGIKVGKYYHKKDDFTIIVPQIKTETNYRHYIEGKKVLDITGDWYKVFIDEKILEDKNYNNKYNCCLRGGLSKTELLIMVPIMGKSYY